MPGRWRTMSRQVPRAATRPRRPVPTSSRAIMPLSPHSASTIGWRWIITRIGVPTSTMPRVSMPRMSMPRPRTTGSSSAAPSPPYAASRRQRTHLGRRPFHVKRSVPPSHSLAPSRAPSPLPRSCRQREPPKQHRRPMFHAKHQEPAGGRERRPSPGCQDHRDRAERGSTATSSTQERWRSPLPRTHFGHLLLRPTPRCCRSRGLPGSSWSPTRRAVWARPRHR